LLRHVLKSFAEIRSGLSIEPNAPQGGGVGSFGRSTRLIGFAEPSRHGLHSFVKVWGRLTRPGDEAVGTHEQSAQA